MDCPGLALFVASMALTLLRFGLALLHRPQIHLALLTLRLRQIGIGLFFVGLGASMFVPALFSGPEIGGLVFGALVAGLGGLYFISASDQMFKTGEPWAAPAHWQHRKPTAGPNETIEAKAERLHKVMHPKEDSSE